MQAGRALTRYAPHLRVMNLDNGGIKFKGSQPRESYAVKLARAAQRATGLCPGTTKQGEPCKRQRGHCPWHEDD